MGTNRDLPILMYSIKIKGESILIRKYIVFLYKLQFASKRMLKPHKARIQIF